MITKEYIQQRYCRLSKVYFITSEGLVKVGISIHPKQRLKEISTSRPYSVLIGVINGGREKEKEIHVQLAPWKYGREWFHFNKIVGAIVDNYINGTV